MSTLRKTGQHVLLLALAACGGTASNAPARPPTATVRSVKETAPPVPRGVHSATHGPGAFDVTASSALLWARTDSPGVLHAALTGAGRTVVFHAAVGTDDDGTAVVSATSLAPATLYDYDLWFADDAQVVAVDRERAVHGKFTTAPAANDPRQVTITWSGDVGGQNICRDATAGYPLIKVINATPSDFFLGLGDMIYADGDCDAVGSLKNAQIPGPKAAIDLPGYRAHWRYNREDPDTRTLMATRGYVAVWDDHEIVNNAGPHHDTRGKKPYTPEMHLLPTGFRSFLEYNAVAPRGAAGGAQTVAAGEAEPVLYRSIRWGKQAEFFLLDTRKYRDSDAAADGESKTMLGAEQMAWLERSLRASDANWKIIVSSVPISLVSGDAKRGHDSWASSNSPQGFEVELKRIFADLRDIGAYNNLWITTDVHFASAFRYTPFPATPDFKIHEVTAGPISAAVSRKGTEDPTFHPERIANFAPVVYPLTYEDMRKWWNYGVIDIDKDANLLVSIHTENVKNVVTLSLPARPSR